MLPLDLIRAIALSVLAFMIGDAFGAAIHDTPEYWATVAGFMVLITGMLICAHRDEMRAYGI
jgi:hypothetical protein